MPQTTAATDDPPPASPQAVDYHGQALTEGATVAFISPDPITLCRGIIRVVGPRQICIDTGQDLYVFDGIQDRITLNVPDRSIDLYDIDGPIGQSIDAKKITGGTVVGTLPDGFQLATPLRYAHVALQAPGDA